MRPSASLTVLLSSVETRRITLSLRIIAGEFRRRKLRTNPGKTTRPISDRMKETLFHHIGDVTNARVADIFAGTGTLGLECLSRGADTAVFMEYDRRAFELLCANVEAVGVSDRAFCWRVDVTKTSFKPKGLDSHLPYSLVFFDPPYPLATDLADSRPLGMSLKRLARDTVTVPEAVMVLRTPNEQPLTLAGAWVEVDQFRISSSRISLCRKKVPSEIAKTREAD